MIPCVDDEIGFDKKVFQIFEKNLFCLGKGHFCLLLLEA